MQYSTLRISALAAVFSASTALAYLDCGGGRAPPKTTVPGCPGYVGPTSDVVASSIIVSSASSVIVSPTSTVIASPTDSVTESSSNGDLISALFDESVGVDDGLCVCSGYFCEFARPGCVSIDENGVRSTIVANPGYETRAFISSVYSSYTATAGSVMYYSADGAMISSKPTATGHLSGSVSSASSSTSHSHTATGTIVSAVTVTGNSSSTITQAPTTMDTSTAPTAANATMSSNTTAPASGLPLTALSSGASKVSGLSSLAIFLGLGMGAMAWL